MKINNKHTNYTIYEQSSPNFGNKSQNLKQLSERGWLYASAAITAIGMAALTLMKKNTNNIPQSLSPENKSEILEDLKNKLREEDFIKLEQKNDSDLVKIYALANMKGLNRAGQEVSVIESYNLKEFISEEIDLNSALECAKMTYIDENGNEKIRWMGGEILTLQKAGINVFSPEFKKLSSIMREDANKSNTGFSYGEKYDTIFETTDEDWTDIEVPRHFAPRFSSYNIIDLIKSGIEINSADFNKLINAKDITDDGNTYPRFNHLQIIENLKADANISNIIKLEEVKTIISCGDGCEIHSSYFSPYNIIKFSKMENVDDIIAFAKIRMPDKNGEISTRFNEDDILKLINMNINLKLATEFAAATVVNPDGTIQPYASGILGVARLTNEFEAKIKEYQERFSEYKNEEFRDFLDKKYNELQNLPILDRIQALDELLNVTEIYDNLRQKYVTIKYENGTSPEFRDFETFRKENNISATKEEKKDLKTQTQIEALIHYCENNRNDYSDILYEIGYLRHKEMTDTERNLLREINAKYKTKVFLPSGRVSKKGIERIKQELEIWEKASNGTANYPPTFDLLRAKKRYIDDTSAFGKSVSSGCCSSSTTKAIQINGYDMVEWALRHEMMHANDLKLLTKFPADWYEADGKTVKQDVKRRFLPEFQRANKYRSSFDYAFNNPKEFIAVAAEGDMSKYSQWFIDQLIDFGMPAWIVNLKYIPSK